MKKTILLVMIFAVIITATACSGGTDMPLINAEISQKDFLSGGMGSEYGGLYRDSSDLVPGALDLTKSNTDNFSVYVNEYPYGQAGPEYEVTDKIKEKTIQNIVTYAELLGYASDELKYNKYNLDDNWSSSADIDGIDVYSMVNYLNVQFWSDISDDTTPDEIKDLLSNDKYLRAACEFLKISNPSVEKKAEYDRYGQMTEIKFFVTEESDRVSDAIVNMHLNYFEIRYYPSLKRGSIFIHNIEQKKSDKESASVSYADAVKRLLADNPDYKEKNIVACEIEYNSAVAPGYFVPCYKFYLEGEDNKPADLGEAYEGGQIGKEEYEVRKTLPVYDDLKTSMVYYVAACDLEPYRAAD